jgi:ligand-binding SRPBCC domain-containing protein
MKIFHLRRSQFVPATRDKVFEFFSDAGNLERITPPTVKFQVTTPLPIAMERGALIDYRLKLFGVPFGWRTLIEEWVPGESFVDRQLKGPYALWRHTHTFSDEGTGTRMDDHVAYAVGFGPFGDLARAMFVTRQVEGIFDHRAKTIGEIFPAA